MSKYIDAEELEDELYEHEFSNWCDKDEVSELIDNMPTTDVVKVVRCKDCKHYVPISEKIGECKDTRMNSTYMSYCSYGEREDDECK